MQCSEAAWSPWAKADPLTNASVPLIRHMTDTLEVAKHLWDHYLAASVKLTIRQAMGADDHEARTLTCWLASIHDIGKASPAFAALTPPTMSHLLARMEDHGLEVPRTSEKVGHATVSQTLLQNWLVTSHDARTRVAGSYACIIGGHHGTNPTHADLLHARRHPHLVGRDAWGAVQTELLDTLAAESGADAYLHKWSKASLPVSAQVLVSAVVIMADWLASNPDYFPYQDSSPSVERVQRAADLLGLPLPWTPDRIAEPTAAHLHTRFPRLRGKPARPLQERAAAAARDASQAPLLILEAPMGNGKTEAALTAAEELAARFGQGGVFVGLPTMATSNPMFERVLDWLQHALGSEDASVALSHGKAALNDTYTNLSRQRWSGILYGDEAHQGQPIVNAWLRGRKKAGLASFVVGTIDQSLFAGLKAKHVSLRHLGLAGKVVIIDEVHAADDYMRTYLTRVLTWLGAYGCPVVLLSATLPPQQRDEFIRAYAAGCDDPRAAELTTEHSDLVARVTSYDGELHTWPVDSGTAGLDVGASRLDDSVESLVDTVRAALSHGGCLGVICNTVGRAQEAYAALQDEFDSDVVLVHSRFIAPDRAQREATLVSLLGPGDEQRPERLVVVGTQVLEQSLDIDFDALITDLAPIDLVLQRLGRVHRHHRASRPAPVAVPHVWLRGVTDWGAVPPTAIRGSQGIYGRKRLLAAAAVLEHREQITLPGDIPALVRTAYDSAFQPPQGWEQEWHAAEGTEFQQRTKAIGRASTFLLGPPQESRSLISWIDVPASDPEKVEEQGRSQVRDSEDSLEVIALFRDDAGDLRLPHNLPEHGGTLIPSDGLPWGTGLEAQIARAMATCTLRLPLSMCHPGVIDSVIEALEQQVDYSGWQGSHWIAGQLVLVFDQSGETRVGPFHLHYDADTGLTVEKEEPAQ